MKKGIILALIFLIAANLVGFGNNEIKLLYEDEKVIDLKKAIDLAIWTVDDSTDNPLDPDAPDDPDEPEIEVPRNVLILVEGKTVTVDGKQCNGTSDIEKRIKACFSPDIKYELKDNYAESHAYKEVLRILEELKNSMGLSYFES